MLIMILASLSGILQSIADFCMSISAVIMCIPIAIGVVIDLVLMVLGGFFGIDITPKKR